MTRHEQLKQAILDRIDALFADTSVDREQTVESLEEISMAIEEKLDALR